MSQQLDTLTQTASQLNDKVTSLSDGVEKMAMRAAHAQANLQATIDQLNAKIAAGQSATPEDLTAVVNSVQVALDHVTAIQTKVDAVDPDQAPVTPSAAPPAASDPVPATPAPASTDAPPTTGATAAA